MYLSLDELFVPLSAVSQVLEKYENEFFKVVDAKINLLRLKRKKVITEGLISKIENADGENAKEILFDHLKSNADMASLKEYCKVVIAADGYPKMQELGQKMLSELPPDGLLECVCVPVYVCMCVHTQEWIHVQCLVYKQVCCFVMWQRVCPYMVGSVGCVYLHVCTCVH